MLSQLIIKKFCKTRFNAKISKKAIRKISEEALAYLKKLSLTLSNLAMHARRKTILERDITFLNDKLSGETFFHINTIRRILKKHTKMQVSRKTLNLVGLLLEDYLSGILEKALSLSRHAKRKTIKEKDVLLAIKKLEKT